MRLILIFVVLITTQSSAAQILQVTNSTVTYKMGDSTLTVSRDILDLPIGSGTYQWYADDISYLKYRATMQGISIPVPAFASDSIISRIEDIVRRQKDITRRMEILNSKIIRSRE